MHINTTITVLLLLAIARSGLSHEGQKATALADSECDVVLHFPKEVALSDHAKQTLRSTAFELAESSNFNSSIPVWRDRWGTSKIQDGYRETVSGKYALVRLKQASKIKTVGGDVVALEIVVGLDSQKTGKNQLFTIDDEGRVISHAKYSGQLHLQMVNQAETAAK